MSLSTIICEINGIETEISIIDKEIKYDISFTPHISFLKEGDRSGVIVAKNILTKSWTELMKLEDRELYNHCGLCTPAEYRKQLIRCLIELWD